LISWLFESVRRSEAASGCGGDRRPPARTNSKRSFERCLDGVYVGTPNAFTRVNAAGLRVLGVRSVEDLGAGSRERGEKFALRRRRPANALTATAALLACAARRSGAAEVIMRRATPARMWSYGRPLRPSSTTIAWSEPSPSTPT